MVTLFDRGLRLWPELCAAALPRHPKDQNFRSFFLLVIVTLETSAKLTSAVPTAAAVGFGTHDQGRLYQQNQGPSCQAEFAMHNGPSFAGHHTAQAAWVSRYRSSKNLRVRGVHGFSNGSLADKESKASFKLASTQEAK